jgi:hypothetical protein
MSKPEKSLSSATKRRPPYGAQTQKQPQLVIGTKEIETFSLEFHDTLRRRGWLGQLIIG